MKKSQSSEEDNQIDRLEKTSGLKSHEVCQILSSAVVGAGWRDVCSL